MTIEHINLADGKYTVVHNTETGELKALRHGEPWMDLTGNKFVYCLAQELAQARADLSRAMNEQPRRYQTAFAPGDKGWVYFDAGARQLTVGKVMFIHTRSPGSNEHLGGIFSIDNDGTTNYDPTEDSFKEECMCAETGIGSGTIYTVGQHIFVTEDACRAAYAEHIELQKKQAAEKLEREIASAELREDSLKRELAELQARRARQREQQA